MEIDKSCKSLFEQEISITYYNPSTVCRPKNIRMYIFSSEYIYIYLWFALIPILDNDHLTDYVEVTVKDRAVYSQIYQNHLASDRYNRTYVQPCFELRWKLSQENLDKLCWRMETGQTYPNDKSHIAQQLLRDLFTFS